MSLLNKFKRFIFSEEGSLKDKAIRSGIWLGVSGVILQFLSIFRSIILARLLTPEMFGLMGICLVLTRGIETFTRPGFAAALIHREHDIEEAKHTVFTLLAIRGILLTAMILSLAPLMSTFYDEEIIQGMLMLMSVYFLFSGFNNVNTIIQQKDLNFRRLAYLEQALTISSTITVITLAYFMRSVWAMVIGYVVTGLFQLVFSYLLIPGKLKFRWNHEIAKELFAYGKYVTGSAIILYFATEIDSALIGKIVGIKELGYYVLAFTTANMATTYISKMLSKIMFPAYSKLQNNPKALRIAYINVFSLVVAITVPIAISIMFFSPQIMITVYGDQWLPAAEPLAVLCLFGIVRSVASLTGFFLNGVGKPEIGFRNSLVRLIFLLVILYPLTINFGLLGAAMAVTAAITIQFLLGLRGVMSIVELKAIDLLRSIFPQIMKILFIYIIFLVGDNYLDTYILSNLVLLILFAAAVYSTLSYKYIMNLFHAKDNIS